MKTFKTIMLIYFILLTIFCTAQINYLNAVRATRETDRSDLSIELKMYEYGFNIDAYSSKEPTTIKKIIALFN